MSYTPLQQDRQARNRPSHKPPPFPPTANTPGSRARPSTSMSAADQAAFAAEASDEKFEEREQRTRAAKILESNEMLIWHSQQANEVGGPYLPLALPLSPPLQNCALTYLATPSHRLPPSIPQTRLRFTKLLAGFAPDSTPRKWADDYGNSGERDDAHAKAVPKPAPGSGSKRDGQGGAHGSSEASGSGSRQRGEASR
ncbi:hypothetical protein B0A49_10015 [Cryomyces minteri]|uniref:Uncharacterized protein n=1 Tax=Cryomyces minteri TaxID=331657 RepID=A0A4U0WH14_9PEZI|nr:hypothetical protein B0A49_10015 [Cryomyces minteri]